MYFDSSLEYWYVCMWVEVILQQERCPAGQNSNVEKLLFQWCVSIAHCRIYCPNELPEEPKLTEITIEIKNYRRIKWVKIKSKECNGVEWPGAKYRKTTTSLSKLRLGFLPMWYSFFFHFFVYICENWIPDKCIQLRIEKL